MATIPVDLRNPGQVFACLGLMEAAEALGLGEVEGGFDYTGAETQTTFTLSVFKPGDPVTAVLKFLRNADLVAESPSETIEDNSFKVTEITSDPVTMSRMPKGDTLGLSICRDGESILRVTSWGDKDSGRDNVKFWGGAAGFSGCGRFAAQRDAVVAQLDSQGCSANPFDVGAIAKSGFSLDGRVGGSALDAGFSSDWHSSIRSYRFPIVEMLAVIGLEHARPERQSRSNYRYGVTEERLSLMLMRAVLSRVSPGFPIRVFEFSLVEPNDYARLIKDVSEIDLRRTA